MNVFDFLVQLNHYHSVESYYTIIFGVQFCLFEALPCFLLIIVLSTSNGGNDEIEQSLLTKK